MFTRIIEAITPREKSRPRCVQSSIKGEPAVTALTRRVEFLATAAHDAGPFAARRSEGSNVQTVID